MKSAIIRRIQVEKIFCNHEYLADEKSDRGEKKEER